MASGEQGEKMGAQSPDYKPIDRLASGLLVLLAISLIVDVIAVVSDLSELSLLGRAARGELVTSAEGRANDLRQLALQLIQIVVFIVTAIVFIVWFHRAYKNLLPLQAGPLRYGTGWAIGGWFVPFLNLVRPKQIMNDIWRASDPELPRNVAHGSGRPVSPWINWWWGAFIISGILARILFRSADDADSLTELTELSRLTLATDVASVVLDVLAIEVVRRVTGRQSARAQVIYGGAPAAVGAGPQTAPPPA